MKGRSARRMHLRLCVQPKSDIPGEARCRVASGRGRAGVGGRVALQSLCFDGSSGVFNFWFVVGHVHDHTPLQDGHMFLV